MIWKQSEIMIDSETLGMDSNLYVISKGTSIYQSGLLGILSLMMEMFRRRIKKWRNSEWFPKEIFSIL